ncbi:MAG: hypothetical protein V1772_09075 [Chloroflexota bacterium]
MNKGMLWYDDSTKRSLNARIIAAADYYRIKYGQRPTVCYVHPSACTDASESPESIKVVRAPYVLPNHLWLGVAEQGE